MISTEDAVWYLILWSHLWPLIRNHSSYLIKAAIDAATCSRQIGWGSFKTSFQRAFVESGQSTRHTTMHNFDSTTSPGVERKSTQVPLNGWRFKLHKGKPLAIEAYNYDRETGERTENGALIIRYVSLWFVDVESIVHELIKEAELKYPPSESTITCVRSWDPDGNLIDIYQTKRSAETLVFKNNVHEKILTICEDFISSEKEYKRTGTPYKLVVMLHGPPGTGKTSIPFFIASALNRSISIFPPTKSLICPTSTSDCVVSIEDLDSWMGVRSGENEADSEKLWELLNFLDSPLTPSGVITFLTTNYIDTLDPALKRPGRINYSFEISKPTIEEAVKLFILFYPDGDYMKFRSVYPVSKDLTMSAISQHLIASKSADEVIDNIGVMK